MQLALDHDETTSLEEFVLALSTRSQNGAPRSCLYDYSVNRALHRSLLEEREQVLIDLVLEGRRHAMRRSLVELEPRVLDQL
jgi:hypothetical protein